MRKANFHVLNLIYLFNHFGILSYDRPALNAFPGAKGCSRVLRFYFIYLFSGECWYE